MLISPQPWSFCNQRSHQRTQAYLCKEARTLNTPCSPSPLASDLSHFWKNLLYAYIYILLSFLTSILGGKNTVFLGGLWAVALQSSSVWGTMKGSTFHSPRSSDMGLPLVRQWIWPLPYGPPHEGGCRFTMVATTHYFIMAKWFFKFFLMFWTDLYSIFSSYSIPNFTTRARPLGVWELS